MALSQYGDDIVYYRYLNEDDYFSEMDLLRVHLLKHADEFYYFIPKVLHQLSEQSGILA